MSTDSASHGWSVEQVASIAPSAAAMTAAQPIATPTRWNGLGAGGDAIWGSFQGSGTEPYDAMVDHGHLAFVCTCPSRKTPCKHALGLLLLWVRGQITDTVAPSYVEAWMQRRSASRDRQRPADKSGAGRVGESKRDRESAAADADADADADAKSGDGNTAGTGTGSSGGASGSEGAGSNGGSGSGGTSSSGGSGSGGTSSSGGSGSGGTSSSGGSGSSGGADARTNTDASSGIGTASTVDGETIRDEQPPPPDAPLPPDRTAARDDRVARMRAGLTELDRWLDDRIRTGLADPSLAQYSTWDSLAARLVDAQAGSLANRIRRLAGLVGASPHWHDDVLAELGILHLLARAGHRIGDLPDGLADAVATSVGWQVRQADVLAGVPDTDEWLVAGRSDVREDRIEVRRHWLRGATSRKWALSLSFAAYQQSLDTSLVVGTSMRADLHRYPGPALRSLVGTRHTSPLADRSVAAMFAASACSIADACDEVGVMVAGEPWLDRVPVTVRARLARSGPTWALTDATGSLPIVDLGTRAFDAGVAMLLAVSEGRPVDLTVEWTPHGVIPLSIHLVDRTIDVGPRVNAAFVSAA